ncbi:hypothetical protein [Ruegeria sp. HKCCE3926]|uniref:hypothetical protein n=1 Tax=Ruegeria sp. HKCCE3926 TaxID=2794831 RepID=UPI001AE2250A|nr:hypothetical protein [Ruegeria sp. HKCCE3926]
MMKKISNLFEDLLILLSQVLFWIFVVVICIVPMSVALPVMGQALEWLREGHVQPRDGFWLYALYECGESWCRPSYLTLTDWVGVNRIINWVLDLHVAIYAMVVATLGYGIAVAWADYIANWKALEEKLRSPSRPQDELD